MNGSVLRDAFISAANNISNHKQKVNALNVFPVPDGDTGTNMSMTISAAKREVQLMDSKATVAEVSKTAASALLRGARGNSGVILSLLFRGFSKSLAGKAEASAADLVEAMNAGVKAAYKAVMKPTEGTILTVARVAHEEGAKALTAAGAKLGFNDEEKHDSGAEAAFERAKETVMAELRQTFRPEFLNRIDDIIVFRALTEEDIREVARRMLKTVSARMETMGIHLDASDEAVAELAKEGFDPKYGARPLRRCIQSKVEDAVAERMLDGTLKEGDTAKLSVEDHQLLVTK